MMIGGVTVRGTDAINRDWYAISLPNGGPPRVMGQWSEGAALVAPGHVLIVAAEVYERLVENRVTTRILPASGWVSFDPSLAVRKPRWKPPRKSPR